MLRPGRDGVKDSTAAPGLQGIASRPRSLQAFRSSAGPGLVRPRGLRLAAACRRRAALDPGKSLTQYRLDSWRTEQGLPQDTVQAVLQTRDGYLWVGTQEGLARFDGTRFRVWDERTTPALGAGSVHSLLEDSRGRLWIGLVGGIARLDGDVFTNLQAGLARGVTAWSFCETPDGDVWVATSGAGLLRFRGDDRKAFTTADGLPANDLRSMLPRPRRRPLGRHEREGRLPDAGRDGHRLRHVERAFERRRSLGGRPRRRVESGPGPPAEACRRPGRTAE